jgi:hypothetical protein
MRPALNRRGSGRPYGYKRQRMTRGIARLLGRLRAGMEERMATNKVAYKYLILGCNKCRYARRDLLDEKSAREKIEPCTRQGKRELGKDGSCKNRRKPIA